MKRAILIVLSILLVIPSHAGNVVTAEKARAIAGDFLAAQSPAGTVTSAVASGKTRYVGSGVDGTWHAYNFEGGGYVLVSGDDAFGPYLAYSRTGTFTGRDLPSNVRSYLSLLEDEVLWYRAHPKAERKIAAVTSETEEVVLNTAKWDQGNPYNLLAPNKSYTGCVATAMAIVMRYNRWPEAGTGTIGGYKTSTKKYEIEAYELGHKYDWDNMPVDGKFLNQDQKDQVARLMYDCGVMVWMDYTTSGSGAYTEDVPGALIEHMGYSKAMRMMSRAAYDRSTWFKMIKDQIDADRPVLYGGSSSEGGHQFVVDGYNSSNYVHINFGWGGKSDDFYMLTDMGGFTSGQDIVINIKKDEGEQKEKYYMFGLYDGCSLKMSTAYTPGNPFNVKVDGFLLNMSLDDFTGSVAAGLDDYYGNLDEIISELWEVEDIPMYYGWEDPEFTCSPSKEVIPGRRVRLYFKPAGSEEWTPCGYNEDDGTIGYVYPAGEGMNFEEFTTINFDKESKVLTVTIPFEGIGHSLKGTSGAEIQPENSADPLTLIYNAQDFSGEYKLTLSYYEQIKEISLKF